MRFTLKSGLLLSMASCAACAASLTLIPGCYGDDTAQTANSKTEVETASKEAPPQLPSPQAQAKQAKLDAATVKGLNRLPGVNLKPADLAPTPVDPPITGFHPIKKLMHPIVQLEKNSVDLQKQIMRLTGPIAGLQGPMLGLQKKMDHVENRMVGMQGTIGDMGGKVCEAADGMTNVTRQLTGVRQDLRSMRKDITDLRKPIIELQQPLHELQGPLGSVSKPLAGVSEELKEMKMLLQAVLVAIVLAAGVTAVGTPIAAVLIWRNRKKLFPNMSDREFSVDKKSDKPDLDKRPLTRV